MFTLDQVVPWGRSFDEYRRMFNLTEADLNRAIVGCADGPAGFNAEANRQGRRVISCDPLYRFDRRLIEQRIASTFDEVLAQTRLNAHEFVWEHDVPTVEELGRVRMAAMQLFLNDYEAGRADGRYIDSELPALPFADRAFEIALCSHLLFLYSVQLGDAFHRAAVLEMCRVADEVRIFPLLALGGEPSPFVPMCLRELRAAGHEVSIEKVPYEFQRGGNLMMRVRRRMHLDAAGG